MEHAPSNLEALNRAHFFHPSTHMAKHVRGESPERVIVGGKGITIVDNQGRESLDAFAGLYCVNVGYGRTEIADAIAEQARKLAYCRNRCGFGFTGQGGGEVWLARRAPGSLTRSKLCATEVIERPRRQLV